MTMDEENVFVCFPGQRICAVTENTIGSVGTYERQGYFYSSLAGIVETKTEDKVSILKMCIACVQIMFSVYF